MKERLVRGTYLVEVVRLIQAHRKDRALPEFGTWEQDLLRKRVSPSTWYSLSVFDSLLQTVHRYIYDGSEAAAQSMGRFAARSALEQLADRLLVPGNPAASLNKMNERWHQLFNFGEVSVTPLDEQESQHRARIQVSGYPDMSACQGHVIMGWSMEMVERAGGKEPKVRLEERPWMHNNLLTYTLEWS
jgi:hypothetical protein